ncbi:Zn(2)-C6 fungal-type domain-containing protein [Fusarium sp. LHS14.1]|nr:Zn(2)-C6 fungal-type domain-containing protein [Fusarium sp. LHS14.1]
MRPVSACVHCRERRKRCLRARQGTSCAYCIDKGLECTVDLKPSPVQDSSRGYAPLVSPEVPTTSRISSAAVPDPHLSSELIDLYFIHVNASFPSLFHRPTLKAAVRDGTVPKVLFLAIISLSARFSSHPGFEGIEPCDRGRPYAEEAQRLLNLRDKSITTIQACILLGTVFQVEGDPNTESIYYAIASRMALLLDLPNAVADSPIEQELYHRIWWSIITIETWHSAALCIPRTLNPDENVPLPFDEWEFSQLKPGSDSWVRPSPTEDSSLSLLGNMVELNQLLDGVNKLNAGIASGATKDENIQQSVQQLSCSLDAWKSSLSTRLQYNDANIAYWVEKNLGQAFLNLHILYNNVGQRLFYQFLYLVQDNTDLSPTDPTYCFAKKCKLYATDFCEIIHRARVQPETQLLSSLVGHMLVIASTVQLHTLLFSPDDGEIAAAKLCLEQNFEVLMHLNSYWPNVSTAMARFNDFHTACLRGRDSSFQLGRWMLQFMLQFSRPLEDKGYATDSRDFWAAEISRYLNDR